MVDIGAPRVRGTVGCISRIEYSMWLHDLGTGARVRCVLE